MEKNLCRLVLAMLTLATIWSRMPHSNHLNSAPFQTAQNATIWSRTGLWSTRTIDSRTKPPRETEHQLGTTETSEPSYRLVHHQASDADSMTSCAEANQSVCSSNAVAQITYRNRPVTNRSDQRKQADTTVTQ